MEKTSLTGRPATAVRERLPKEQLPRERLLRLGPDQLSDRELLTILLAGGTPGRGADCIAGDILQAAQGALKRLLTAHPARLLQIRGLGQAKYCMLAAALELGRRLLLRSEEEGSVIRNSRQAWEAVREFIPADGREMIIALLLDNRNRVLGLSRVSGKRHPAGSDLDLRALLSAILLHNASGVILAHNHPSGEENPSSEDIRMTRDLAAMLSGMGTELIDHLIVTDTGYTRINWG